jgi:hypothetical protein
MPDTGLDAIPYDPSGIVGMSSHSNIPDPPQLIQYVMEPHVEAAFWLIAWAILIILIGWFVDICINEIRKSRKPDQ